MTTPSLKSPRPEDEATARTARHLLHADESRTARPNSTGASDTTSPRLEPDIHVDLPSQASDRHLIHRTTDTVDHSTPSTARLTDREPARSTRLPSVLPPLRGINMGVSENFLG